MIRAILTTLLVSVLLAGCAGKSDVIDDTPVNRDDFNFAANTGGIYGLLVDDRYRPIDLEEKDAGGEYQAIGFILVQEAGLQTRTNVNGEFTVTDLEPGTYTLRISASDHEAIPQKVQVVAGEFTEITVSARRTASDTSFIISTEYSAFVPCGANIIVFGTSFDCLLDQSGDSERVAFTSDFSNYPEATYMIQEMTANKKEFYDIWVQRPGNQVCSGAYSIDGGPDSDYVRFQFKKGEAAAETYATCGNLVWENDAPMETVVYLNSLGYGTLPGFGAGVYYGIQANFVQNLFVGEPQVDIDTFCAYCR